MASNRKEKRLSFSFLFSIFLPFMIHGWFFAESTIFWTLLIHILPQRNDYASRVCILKSGQGPVLRRGLRVRNSEGFSLVELVLTLVLIGILAAVAVAKYINLSDKTKAAVCRANQHALESAQTICYADQITKNDNTPQYASTLNDLTLFMSDNSIPTCPLGFEYEILPEGKIRCPYPDHRRH
jgi:prepilin-type N-terminal cleavage/methylation domain-containing protein